MRNIGAVLGVLVFSLVSKSVTAQENYTNGPIERVLLVAITPGHGPEFWQDIRQNIKPLYDSYKKQGMIDDWGTFLKTTKEERDDWDVGLTLLFKNWAALDAFAARVDSVVIRQFGSKETRDQLAKKRSENGTLVSSILIRHVSVKDWTK
jgi:hypothetical protein